jgi:hypothetical protein
VRVIRGLESHLQTKPATTDRVRLGGHWIGWVASLG